MHSIRRRAVLAAQAVLLFALAAACQTDVTTTRLLADACDNSDQCEGNLKCANALSDLEGVCTEPCGNKNLGYCRENHNDFAYCGDGLCVLMCGDDSHCSGQTRCGGRSTDGAKYCILREQAATGGSGDLGAPCSSDGQCAGGLFCATGGSLGGVCAAGCSGNPSFCEAQFGVLSTCSEGLCVLLCDADLQCAQATKCRERVVAGDTRYCVSQ